MLISEAFDLYIMDHIVFMGQSAKTQESYEATLKIFILRFGDIPIEGLDFKIIREWKLWMDKGRSANTVRGYIVCMRSVLRFIKRRGVDVIDSDDIPVPRRVCTEVEYLTETEFESLLDAVSRRNRGYSAINRLRNIAILKTLYATGLRNAELCSLNVGVVKDNTFTVVGKGGKPRVCFVEPDAIAAINDYVNVRDDTNVAMFCTKSGKRMTTGDVRRVFESIRTNYPEFAGIHPHTLRHSYATRLLKKRVDIRYIKEFMGHSSLETTSMYTHVVNEDLKEIYMRVLT